ncbi:uncharacterized protein LOC119070163 [Bradysia coprophila]|uniref:uncharacterized protein LOC119070163 n=1 Tax=Bradysia coprophila TaxID=38358 RepID=UPI00187DBE1E|nr:uncharacterized protein LOC119070163 [Bradysia coprophila]
MSDTNSIPEIGNIPEEKSVIISSEQHGDGNIVQHTAMIQDEASVSIKASINIHANTMDSCDNPNPFKRPASDKTRKMLWCPFCCKSFLELDRHLATVHKEEQDVEKFVSLPKGSEERRVVADSLRKTGIFKFNCHETINNYESIPRRRPSRKSEKMHIDYRQNPTDREMVHMAQLFETAAGKFNSNDKDNDGSGSDEVGVAVSLPGSGSTVKD